MAGVEMKVCNITFVLIPDVVARLCVRPEDKQGR